MEASTLEFVDHQNFAWTQYRWPRPEIGKSIRYSKRVLAGLSYGGLLGTPIIRRGQNFLPRHREFAHRNTTGAVSVARSVTVQTHEFAYGSLGHVYDSLVIADALEAR